MRHCTWLLAVLLLCAARPALAGPVADLDAPAYGGASPTYRQLVRSVFTDARDDPATGDLVTTSEKILRQPGTKQRTVLPEGVRLKSFEFIRVRGDARRYLILRMDAEDPDPAGAADNGASVLAVFPEGDAEPQDVADVKSDRLTSLSSQPALPLGDDDGFFVTNHHFNSNQGYLDTALFHIRQGRLRRIGSVFTFALRGMCDRSFEQNLAWRTQPGASGQYPAVTATVSLSFGPGEYEASGCPRRKPAPARTYSQTWTWSQAAGRYQAAGEGLRELDKFNKDKF